MLKIFLAVYFLILSGFANADVQIAGEPLNQDQLNQLLETPKCQDFIDYMSGEPTDGPAGPETLVANTFAVIVQDVNGENLLNLNPRAEKQDIFKLFSISKTLTALAFGRLVHLVDSGLIEGKDAYGVTAKIGYDSEFTQFLSPYDYPEAHALIRDKMTSSPTARHLIGMASGIPWCEYVSCSSRDTLRMNYGGSENVVMAYVKNLNNLEPGELATPGERYNYSAGNAVLLQAMMRTFLGDNYESFFKNEVFGPLGIWNYRFERDGTGLYLGGSGLFLSGDDLAKIGQLLIRKGKLGDGSQFLNSEFIEWITSPNQYANSDLTPAEIKIWEGPVGSSLWINRRLDGLAQFMPRVPESMYYGAGFYGQRLIVFPEHETQEQQDFDGKGLGLVLTRIGAEPPLGANSYSNHWNTTVDKFYQCFSGGDDVLDIPEDRQNLPSACRSPQLTKLKEEVEFTKEFALNLYPYLISSLELCNCLYVQDKVTLKEEKRGRKTVTVVDKEATLAKCSEIAPMEWPEAVTEIMRPTRTYIQWNEKSVTVAGNPFQNQAGIDLGGGFSNKRATATFDPATMSCSLTERPAFGWIGRNVVGPIAESTATESFQKTEELMNLRLEEIRREMEEKGIPGEPVQDGCYDHLDTEE